MRAPRVGSVRILHPAGIMDKFDDRVTDHTGHQVELTQPYGCPKNGTMDMAYVNCLTCAEGEQTFFVGLVNLTSLRVPGQCATIGCKRNATHTVTYSYPEARSFTESEDVCLKCGTEYMSRPTLKASLAPLS